MQSGHADGAGSDGLAYETNPLHWRSGTCAGRAEDLALSQANAALIAEIRRREELERALREKEEALQEADRRKDEFLAMLAHELRNPLAPILTAAELLRRTTRGDRGVERFRERDRAAGEAPRAARRRPARRLAHHARRDHPAKKKVDLGNVVARRHRRDAALGRRGPPRPRASSCRQAVLYVDGDPTRLEQVFVNLLNNASKYTSPGGKIEVVIEHDGQHRDGAREGQRHRHARGSLAARVRPVRPGKPHPRPIAGRARHRAHAREEPRRDARRRGRGEERRRRQGQRDRGEAAAQRGRPARAARRASGGRARGGERSARRALVVEDNVDAADMLSELLGCWGYDVRAVPSGEAGVEVARSFVPHVVLLDIALPGMNGFEVAKRLRSSAPCDLGLIRSCSSA